MSEPVDIEVVGGPETSNFSKSELGAFAPKEEAASAVTTTTEVKTTPTEVATEATLTSESPAWMWADGIKGEGDKPEYLLEKYKSVAEQARALPEALKRFGAFKGAPEAYSFDNLPEGIDKASPILQGFTDTFKEMNLDQQGFEKMASKFAEIGNSMAAKSQEEIVREAGSKEVVDRVANWAKNFSPEVQESIKEWSLSGKDIKALDMIRAGRANSVAPTANQFESRHSYETVKAIEAEKNKNWKQYQNDEAYRSEIARRWEEADNREQSMRG
jgi:hypothetical protein